MPSAPIPCRAVCAFASVAAVFALAQAPASAEPVLDRILSGAQITAEARAQADKLLEDV